MPVSARAPGPLTSPCRGRFVLRGRGRGLRGEPRPVSLPFPSAAASIDPSIARVPHLAPAASCLVVPPFLLFAFVLVRRPALLMLPRGSGRSMATLIRVWEWEVDLDSALDVALWCLPLLLVAWLVGRRVARGDPLDPVADAAAAAAAAVAVANVVARRRLRFRCLWRR
ncbi:hypothetical protein C2845_PM11G20180 [Panicum miliaceum]|uniref:Uncharacterized protein n=1 Tax=Panicum miliaceum TaxID=4540 RepID=A0A3L6RMV4_PANMI|nr:hypothetical protein C2845_PM11G20180 [Panicum miliaceum]